MLNTGFFSFCACACGEDYEAARARERTSDHLHSSVGRAPCGRGRG